MPRLISTPKEHKAVNCLLSGALMLPTLGAIVFNWVSGLVSTGALLGTFVITMMIAAVPVGGLLLFILIVSLCLGKFTRTKAAVSVSRILYALGWVVVVFYTVIASVLVYNINNNPW